MYAYWLYYKCLTCLQNMYLQQNSFITKKSSSISFTCAKKTFITFIYCLNVPWASISAPNHNFVSIYTVLGNCQALTQRFISLQTILLIDPLLAPAGEKIPRFTEVHKLTPYWESIWPSISRQFDSNILQLLGIPGRNFSSTSDWTF